IDPRFLVGLLNRLEGDAVLVKQRAKRTVLQSPSLAERVSRYVFIEVPKLHRIGKGHTFKRLDSGNVTTFVRSKIGVHLADLLHRSVGVTPAGMSSTAPAFVYPNYTSLVGTTGKIGG